MPELHDPKKERGEKRNFITEKVVKRPLTRRQLVKRGLLFSVAAFLFGTVAGVGFSIARPLTERYLIGEKKEEPTVSIPKDDPADVTMAASAEETETEEQSEPIEEIVQSAMESYRFTVGDLNSIISSLRVQVQKANNGVVTVHSVQQETDWFDNPVETTGLYAGVVIADTSQELLILTPESAVAYSDSVRVTFGDSEEVTGRVKQRDRISGMAVVSAAVEDLSETALQNVAVLPLGNSYTVKEGDMVIAVGGPAGIVHSIDYGFISYVQKNVQMVDQIERVLYTGVGADVDKGTFLLNTSGELIGWAMTPHQEEKSSPMTEIRCVSGYKGILEKLSNGQEAPCFGIIGQSVSEDMEAGGLPKGIYVMSAVTDGPAYNAGIQNGDIITRIDDKEMGSMKDFQGMVDGMQCGQVLLVTVQRNGRDQFTELQFQVTVGAR